MFNFKRKTFNKMSDQNLFETLENLFGVMALESDMDEIYLAIERDKAIDALQGNAENDIVLLEKERLKWSLKTFTEATAISSLRKLESEIDEIESDIKNGIKEPEEYADALMCLFDSAGRHGIGVEEIISAFAVKLEKNKNRVWKRNPDNSYSHVKK